MEVTQISLLKNALVGKKVKHKNQYNREVTLEVEDVTVYHGSRQITPDTPENDWWGESESWTDYYLHFVDGSKIKFNPESTINVVD